MHVRVAPPDGGPRLNVVRPYRPLGRSILIVALGACWLAGACHRPARARNLTFDWSLTPRPPVAGPATLTLRILDAARHAVTGAELRVEAQMAHPGMATVVVQVTERTDGVYQADLNFTMGGDWILLVAGSLANGERVQYRIDVANVRSSGGSADVPS